MIATILDVKDLGNAAIYVRIRDAQLRFWNFTTSAWVSVETVACRWFLTEYPDGVYESRYQAEITHPTVEFLVEYVQAGTGVVIGEEGPPAPGSGSGTNPVIVTALHGAVPVSNVLVQAFAGAEVLADLLTDVNGVAILNLPEVDVTITLAKPSWGTFPSVLWHVAFGSQTITVQGTPSSPPAAGPIPYAILIPVGDVNTRLMSGYSAIEVQRCDDEATWVPMTAPVATPTLQAHIPLVGGTYAYTFLDPVGTPKRRYRWRYSANGSAPISPFFPWVLGTQRLADVPISIGTMRFVGMDGVIRPGTLLVAALDSATTGAMFVGDMRAFTSDSTGFLAVPLVQGSNVRIAIEGTSIVRDILVPATDTFDIMSAVAAAPDQFTVQTVAPMLTKRAL